MQALALQLVLSASDIFPLSFAIGGSSHDRSRSGMQLWRFWQQFQTFVAVKLLCVPSIYATMCQSPFFRLLVVSDWTTDWTTLTHCHCPVPRLSSRFIISLTGTSLCIWQAQSMQLPTLYLQPSRSCTRDTQSRVWCCCPLTCPCQHIDPSGSGPITSENIAMFFLCLYAQSYGILIAPCAILYD
jgi:hypothetical protein